MTNRITFLKGKTTFFSPLEEEDAPTLQRYPNDPEIRHNVRRIFPINLNGQKDWIKNCNNEHNVVLGVCLIKTGELIGSMGLHRIDWVNRTATTGTIIGNKEHQNKGYGTDAKMVLLKYAFHTLGLRKICSSAYAFNRSSIAFNQKCGYKIEGRLKKQVLREGKYVDEVLLAVFEKDWSPLWQEYEKSL